MDRDGADHAEAEVAQSTAPAPAPAPAAEGSNIRSNSPHVSQTNQEISSEEEAIAAVGQPSQPLPLLPASPSPAPITPELRSILADVHPDVLTFFGNLNGFYTNKKGIEALRAQIVEPGVLESIEVAAVGIQDEATGEFNLTFYQRQKDGTTPIKSTDELYEAAALALPHFEQMLRDIGNALDGVKVKLSPSGLKKRDRAERKAKDDYSSRPSAGGGPAVGWVYDLVRGTFMCESAAAIKHAVERLVADPRVKAVLKFKNRFKNPTPSGFCDMMLQIVLVAGDAVHVCEVQVHLRPIYEFDQAHESHKAFEYFRNFFDGSMKTVAARLKDVDEIVGPGFKPAADGTPAAVVLEQLVVDVAGSEDVGRMDAMAGLCRKYLQVFDLAGYLYKAVLAVELEAFGEDHKNVGGTYNNMALVLQVQGKYAEAMEYHQKALAIKVKALGEDDADVGGTYSNMASVLDDQGKYAEAMEYYQKALAIQVKALGEDHVDVGGTCYSMAVVLNRQRKYAEAMDCCQKALAIQVKALGEDHADVGGTYTNMASVLESQGKHAEAMECFQKAIAIRVKALGEDHADVGGACYNVAIVLYSQGKYAEAMEYYQKALAIRVKALGEDHVLVGQTYTNMAHLAIKQGNMVHGLEYLSQAAHAFTCSYGADHEATRSTLGQVDAIKAVVELQAAGVVAHPFVYCDGCGMNPFIGTLYSKTGCDYDLCEADFNKLPDEERVCYKVIAKPGDPPIQYML